MHDPCRFPASGQCDRPLAGGCDGVGGYDIRKAEPCSPSLARPPRHELAKASRMLGQTGFDPRKRVFFRKEGCNCGCRARLAPRDRPTSFASVVLSARCASSPIPRAIFDSQIQGHSHRPPNRITTAPRGRHTGEHLPWISIGFLN